MIKRASDENFDGDVVRGLLRRVPELDIVRIQDANLAGRPIRLDTLRSVVYLTNWLGNHVERYACQWIP